MEEDEGENGRRRRRKKIFAREEKQNPARSAARELARTRCRRHIKGAPRA